METYWEENTEEMEKAMDVQNTLQQLIDKLEHIQRQEQNENENTEKLLLVIERMAGELIVMEEKRKEEENLICRLELLNKNMEKVLEQNQSGNREISMEQTLRKVVNGIRITGQVITILASSAQVAVNSISALMHNTISANHIDNKEVNGITTSDLSNLLETLTTVAQALINSPEKQTTDSIEEDKKSLLQDQPEELEDNQEKD